jgi:hypothetical protein
MNGSPGDHGTRHEGLDRGIIPLEGSTMTTPGGTIAAAAVPLVLALTPGGTALAERFPPTASAAPAPRVREETVDLRPLWDTERVLRNPGKGFYHHLLDNGVERYAIRDEAAFRSFPGRRSRTRGGRTLPPPRRSGSSRTPPPGARGSSTRGAGTGRVRRVAKEPRA